MRLGRRERVRVERDGPPRRGRNRRDVLGGVDARELLARGDVGRRDFPPSRPPAGGDDLHDFGALGALGVAGRHLMFHEAVGGDQDQGHGFGLWA